MSAYSVSLEKEEQLAQRMARLGVREADLEEAFVRSGGPGGQNVNKTATCVVLLHRPTGVQIKCQATRQQGLNRYQARLLLLEKLEGRQREREEALRAHLAKVRRQNRRPSRRAKERTLADKARHAAKKSLRRRVGLD
jgi:protein subunit release factor B